MGVLPRDPTHESYQPRSERLQIESTCPFAFSGAIIAPAVAVTPKCILVQVWALGVFAVASFKLSSCALAVFSGTSSFVSANWLIIIAIRGHSVSSQPPDSSSACHYVLELDKTYGSHPELSPVVHIPILSPQSLHFYFLLGHCLSSLCSGAFSGGTSAPAAAPAPLDAESIR
jgi:hypothetical protein